MAVGAGYLALGTMTSAMAESQPAAAMLSTTVIVGMFILGIGEFVFDVGPLHDLCSYVSVWSQMNDFSQGLVDSRRLAFDATAIALPLFITVRAVDAWRWG
jgi:ABC-2 type transport system permease protein